MPLHIIYGSPMTYNLYNFLQSHGLSVPSQGTPRSVPGVDHMLFFFPPNVPCAAKSPWCRMSSLFCCLDKAGIARNVALGIANETEICLEHLRTTSDNSF